MPTGRSGDAFLFQPGKHFFGVFAHAGERLAQGTVGIAALLGFGFPVVAAGFALGKLPHRLRALTSPHGDRAWEGEVALDMLREERAMSGAVHLVSARAT